ncbi:glycoside hydrolase family 31 protein [Paenibacillus sp. DMB5]|uniref:glycoside hydrolase family 31 protein n=1 Tax=Paenibacillus sp. DMB5 TaxID=1780103 RepID=UPI00076D9DC9|nr:glycoside hydrolase family 31 protein [Paenibacillus sp. DMB5]KUP22531.1 glycoside hydrolase [Paenibacillus sp. DMB5]
MEQKKLRVSLLEKEYWWGGRVADGTLMPYAPTEFQMDLSEDLGGNQACPLLLSNRGRYVWSEQPFSFRIDHSELVVEGQYDGELNFGQQGSTLREVYQYVSLTFFSSTGDLPAPLLFTAPQYNLWIEMLYQPTQEKVLKYAEKVLSEGLPVGVIMIDDNWHESYGTWEFHSGRFPDPKAMADQLHQMGFQLMLWVCPLVSPDSLIFRQLESTGMLLGDHNGQTVIRHWWNGYSAVLDCTNPDTVKWLRTQLNSLQERYGVDGFKFDAGDLFSYDSTDRSYLPSTKNEQCEAWAHIGLEYSLNEYRACWKMAGQPLVQRLMDKHHSWNENGLASLIPCGLAQGLMGYAYTCPDMIGGGEYIHFTANADSLDQELFVRYAQCSALFPMMQFSAAPWRVLDQKHASLCYEAARLHADYAAEIMKLAEHAAATGEPILRHMAYVFPEENFENVTDQFMLGDEVLVAPVLEKGALSRTVSFPEGNWLGDDGKIVFGPCAISIKAPLERLPRYRRTD